MNIYMPEGIYALVSYLVFILSFISIRTGLSLKDLLQADKNLEDRS